MLYEQYTGFHQKICYLSLLYGAGMYTKKFYCVASMKMQKGFFFRFTGIASEKIKQSIKKTLTEKFRQLKLCYLSLLYGARMYTKKFYCVASMKMQIGFFLQVYRNDNNVECSFVTKQGRQHPQKLNYKLSKMT